MSDFFDDASLDAQLRETPLPERFLERLQSALWTTDEALDDHLLRVAPPSALLLRLREIPDHEAVDDQLCEVAVPSRLMSRLRATTVVRPAPSPAKLVRELATAAALLIGVSLVLGGGGYWWLGTTLSAFARPNLAPQSLYMGPPVVEVAFLDRQNEFPVIVGAEVADAMPAAEWPLAEQPELFVSLPEEASLPEAGPVGRWLAAQSGGLKPWDNWIQLRWGLLGAGHDDRDDGVRLEDLPRVAPVGIEPPLAKGYNRAFWLQHHVFPPLSPAVAELRSFAAPLTVDRDGVARWEELVAGGRKPAAKEIRAEEFAAAVLGTLPELPAGKPSLIVSGAPSPFGPPQSVVLQVLAAAGPALEVRPAKQTVVALDLSASMGRRGGWTSGKRALAALADKLGPHDRLSLTGFRDDVEVQLENIAAGDVVEWREAMLNLKAGGGADLAVGLRQALSLALEGERRGETELVVLTDHDGQLSPATHAGLQELLRSAKVGGVQVRWFQVGGSANVIAPVSVAARAAGVEVTAVDGVRGAIDAYQRRQAAPIAADVQARLDFNPQVVAAYRLIGSEAGSWSQTDTAPRAIDLRAGEVGQCLFELTLAAPEGDLGSVTLTWRDPTTGQTKKQVQPLSRSALAYRFDAAPGHLQRACVAAEAAEVLRGTRDALRDLGWNGKEPHDLASVTAAAKQISGGGRSDAEFARLLQLLEGSRRK